MNIRKPRGMILLLSFLSLFVALTFQNKIIALVFMAMCLLSAVLILYRHMGDLTDIAGDNPKMKTLKSITIFNGVLVIVGVVAAVLIRTEFWNFSANSEKYFAAAVVAVVILFSGNVAPKLPFNRHTGLRLPWTIMDEDTWLVAHRILGYVSIPLAVVYIAGVFTTEYFELLTFMIVLLWVSVPAGLSYAFYYKKTHRKL